MGATLAALLPGIAFAAGTNAGVEAGFFALGTDLNTILNGAGGFVILIASVIIGGVGWAVAGRMAGVAAALGVAVFLGYGVTILTSLSGVTATTDMISDLSVMAPEEATVAAQAL